MKGVYHISQVLRVLIPFAMGVLAGMRYNLSISAMPLLALSILLWLLLLLITIKAGGFSTLKSAGYLFLLFLLAFVTGTGIAAKDRFRDPGLEYNRQVLVRGRVLKIRGCQGERYSFELLSSVLSSDSLPHKVKTKLLVYMDRSEGMILPQVGEEWQLLGKVVPIQNSGRRGDPDYKGILARKNCFYRFYLNSDSPLNRALPAKGHWHRNALQVRDRLSSSWHGKAEVRALLMALCLGDRSQLDPDLKSDYAAAGGMHLLAVSGLHVGLIWMVLNYVVGFLSRIFRSVSVKVILITLILWYYAYLTGFSASVCRSVTMFSFYSIARLIRTQTDPIHVTYASALLLLLVRPSWIMDAGFQLSYTAVLSILTLYPLIRELLPVRFVLLKKAWELSCVSIAAQLGTFPLVIYYFKQFPVLGLLTNLLAVPLVSGILILFVISLPLNLCGAGNVASELLIFLGGLLNRLMHVIGSMDWAVIGNLQLGSLQTKSILALIFFLALAWRRRRIRAIIPALFIAAFLIFLSSV